MNNVQDHYINPLTYFGYQRLFGSGPDKAQLIEFLNVLLPERHQVADLDCSSSEVPGFFSFHPKAIFDLYCRSCTGERFLVKVQKAQQLAFAYLEMPRSLFNRQADQTKLSAQERQKRLHVARAMKAAGEPLDKIAAYTGLPESEI